ncbi:MAG: aspartate-semialdehyde dehydrogenase [Anaerolineales bacterium]|nr:aspartate-semialdehyde dehydrogenase [Anaerolineales bacterium]
MQKLKVAILGATGAVGQRFVQLLEGHPWFEIHELVASTRSAGRTYGEATNWVLDGEPPREIAEMTVKELGEPLESPLVFSALPSDTAREIEIHLAEAGHVVCSNASANRMVHDVPLLIPEVNADHVRLIDQQRQQRGWQSGAVVTNSNCTSMPVTMALAPLLQFEPTHLQLVSMQAISGAGYPGVASLDILDNVIPYIGGEEEKLAIEPRKMLGILADDLSSVHLMPATISTSCNRVPVLDAHLVSMAVRFATNPTMADIEAAWEAFVAPNVVQGLPSAPPQPVIYTRAADRPQPRRDRMAGNGMSTVVGRLRDCAALDGVQFLALAHNTIRGAAGCSILNAELLAATGYIHAFDTALIHRV